MSSHSAAAPIRRIVCRRRAGAWFLDETTLAGTARVAVRVAGVLVMVVCLIALPVRLALAGQAQAWLAYPFTGIPAEARVATAIFLHNLRALSMIGGLLLIAQASYWSGETAPGAIQWALQRLGEVALGAAVLANLAVIGLSFGAYGTRMIRAALPHGPLELASYSLGLALYLQGRHRRLAGAHVLKVGLVSVALLALAAALETFVSV